MLESLPAGRLQTNQRRMTNLSVNINKIALLRNSRGRGFPSVRQFAERCLELGAHGITLHPRPDQRHARYSDIHDLKSLCEERRAELNVEGYPSDEFLEAVLAARPAQCTLVPDSPDQITSDHGWRLRDSEQFLRRVIATLREDGIRVSLFIDCDSPEVPLAHEFGADRIELYTEPYALASPGEDRTAMLSAFRSASLRAQDSGLGVNAGHDLNLENLAEFLTIPGILEVSIGHALIVECIESGVEAVIRRYLNIVEKSPERKFLALLKR